MVMSATTGGLAAAEETLAQGATLRVTGWKRDYIADLDYGSDVVPYLLAALLNRPTLATARGLIEDELTAAGYAVESLALRTEGNRVYITLTVAGQTTPLELTL